MGEGISDIGKRCLTLLVEGLEELDKWIDMIELGRSLKIGGRSGYDV
ncbi:hypothetical protein [Staphylococcus aureus]|nr:hypothetical protein [Staphylococcus aureus]